MNLHRQLSEHARRLRGWLVPVVLLALAPKCFLCALAYVGAGTALSLGGPEICGADNASRSWPIALPVLGTTLVAASLLVRRNRTFNRPPVHSDGNISSSSTSKIRPDNGGTLPACMLP